MTLIYHDEESVRKIVRQEVKEEVKSQLSKFRSDVFNKLDKIIGLMVKSDQEVTVLSEHSKRHSDQLESQAKRLKKLESSRFVS